MYVNKRNINASNDLSFVQFYATTSLIYIIQPILPTSNYLYIIHWTAVCNNLKGFAIN